MCAGYSDVEGVHQNVTLPPTFHPSAAAGLCPQRRRNAHPFLVNDTYGRFSQVMRGSIANISVLYKCRDPL